MVTLKLTKNWISQHRWPGCACLAPSNGVGWMEPPVFPCSLWAVHGPPPHGGRKSCSAAQDTPLATNSCSKAKHASEQTTPCASTLGGLVLSGFSSWLNTSLRLFFPSFKKLLFAFDVFFLAGLHAVVHHSAQTAAAFLWARKSCSWVPLGCVNVAG